MSNKMSKCAKGDKVYGESMGNWVGLGLVSFCSYKCKYKHNSE